MNQDLPASSKTLTFRIFAAILVTVVVAGLAVVLFGLPALGIVGLLLTVAVFGVMLAFTAGN